MATREAEVRLSEADVLSWVQDFLDERGLVGSARALELEAGGGVTPGSSASCRPPELAFLRGLILDGRWSSALEFLDPLGKVVAEATVNGLRFVLLKQQYLELLCYDPHSTDHPLDQWASAASGDAVNASTSGRVMQAVMACLSRIRGVSSGEDDFRSLCSLLGSPTPWEHPSLRSWTRAGGRRAAFRAVAPHVAAALGVPYTNPSPDYDQAPRHGHLVRLLSLGLAFKAADMEPPRKAVFVPLADGQRSAAPAAAIVPSASEPRDALTTAQSIVRASMQDLIHQDAALPRSVPPPSDPRVSLEPTKTALPPPAISAGPDPPAGEPGPVPPLRQDEDDAALLENYRAEHEFRAMAAEADPRYAPTLDVTHGYHTKRLDSSQHLEDTPDDGDDGLHRSRLADYLPGFPNAHSMQLSPWAQVEDRQVIRTAAFHPRGEVLAVGSNSQTLRLCQVRTPVEGVRPGDLRIRITRNQYHRGSIYCLAWNPTGDIVATGSNDKSIRILRFDADAFEQGSETEIQPECGTVRDIAFATRSSSLGSDVFATGGGGDFSVSLFSCETGQAMMSLKGHTGQITAVRTEGDVVYAASMDKTVRIWDSRSALCIGSRQYPCSVTALCHHSESLVAGLVDGSCIVADCRSVKERDGFRVHEQDCRSVDVSPDGRWLLSSSYDHTIAVTDLLATTPEPRVVARHEDKVTCARWHPSRPGIMSASVDRTARLWSLHAEA